MGKVIEDVFGTKKKNQVMGDTWGHMFPEPKSKHKGTIVIAIGEYGNQIVVTSHFPTLGHCSPMRHALEHSIFDYKVYGVGIWAIDCTLWFFKDCQDAYLSKPVGKVIGITSTLLDARTER